MARFLVTGGAGFIGSNLVDFLLANDEQVRVVDNLSTGSLRNLEGVASRIEFIEGDLRDPKVCARAVSGMEYVLHQAAVPSVPRSVAAPVPNHESNLTATLNLLVHARGEGVKRFVYAGSSSVYGDQPGERKHEGMLPAPLSPYAAAKLAGEHYLQVFATCYGLETVTLRYFNVFGPRQDPNSPYSAVVPKFICAALRGEAPEIHGDGLQARDFTFVENNVRAVYLAAAAPIRAAGQAYNIATGEAQTLLELWAGIQRILGVEIRPRHTEGQVGDVRISRADISRASRELGYQPEAPFGEGLRRTIAWYRERLSPAESAAD